MYEHDTYRNLGKKHLKKGDFVGIDLGPNKWASDAVHVASVGMGVGQSGRQDTLEIFDLRQAPPYDGKREFNGILFPNDIDFIVMSPDEFDIKARTGFKAVRAGEPVVFGRGHYTERFKHLQDETSRSHVKIEFVEATDKLVFEDMSTNGTDITSDFAMYDVVDLSDNDKLEDQTTTRSWLNSEHEAPTDEIVKFISLREAQKEAESWLADKNTPRVTHDIASVEGYRPTAGIEIEGKSFFVSDMIFDESGRAHIVGYSTDNYNRVVPRLFYKSNSDGGWRITPCIHNDGVYDKGGIWVGDHEGRYVEYGQYVQATKPTEALVAFLEKRERSGAASRILLEKRLFSEQKYDESDVSTTLQDEVKITCVLNRRNGRLDAYGSGKGFSVDRSMAIGELETMSLPEGFEPNFRNGHTREYSLDHTILGKTRVRVFKARLNNKEVEWHVACDEATQTVWLDRIVTESSNTTSFGTQSEVVLAGALSAKPVDYVAQSRNMFQGEDYDRLSHTRTYISVKPTLDRMPWVKRFREVY